MSKAIAFLKKLDEPKPAKHNVVDHVTDSFGDPVLVRGLLSAMDDQLADMISEIDDDLYVTYIER